MNNLTTLENPLYSSDMPTAYFHLFPQLKSALKERCFCDATDIVNIGTEGLKRLSQNGFQEFFQHLYIRW